MKKLPRAAGNISVLMVLLFVASCQTSPPPLDNPVQGWAILAERDHYEPVFKPDLPVDYIDIARMRQALEASGWQSDHIHSLRDFDRQSLQAELDWLKETADENDIVLLYVSAHGYYLRDGVGWRHFFADHWDQVPSHRRVLVVDSSFAALFTNAVAGSSSPHLSVAAVDATEQSWKGLEEEGLPIIGGVFTHYFAAALHDPTADANGDGRVSIQEAALIAEERQRTYLHEVVLVVPEFVDQFHAGDFAPERDPTYPHVIVDDTIGEPLYLALDAYP